MASEESHVVELTTEEFDLTRMSIEASVNTFAHGSINAPTEEDQLLENEVYLQYKDLQNKFPPMEDIVLKDEDDK